MHRVVKKSESLIKKIADNKISYNFITKELSPNVSLAVIESKDFSGEELTKYNRIYYMLEGELNLDFKEEKFLLQVGDTCFVSKGTQYKMFGTFKVIVINQPAFGT